MLGKVERTGRRRLERQQIQAGQVVNVHMRPDVFARPDMRRHTTTARQIDQPGHLHAVRFDAGTASVNKTRADNDRMHTLARTGQNVAIQSGARHPGRRRLEGRGFVEYIVGGFTAGAGTDHA